MESIEKYNFEVPNRTEHQACTEKANKRDDRLAEGYDEFNIVVFRVIQLNKMSKPPLDINEFSKLINQGECWVDQSLLIGNLIDLLGSYVITRPRRWGKMTNILMIEKCFRAEFNREGNIVNNNRSYDLFMGTD